ncbi:MAG: sulfatase-like hydrolase/transferase [Erysipelothrix sp.]
MNNKKTFKSIKFTLVFVLFFQVIMTASLLEFNFIDVFKSISGAIPEYLFSTGLLLVLFYTILLLFNNFLFAGVFISALTLLLAVTNVMKLNMLLEPIFPSDLSFMKNIPDLLNMMTKHQFIMIIASTVMLVILVAATLWYNSLYPNYKFIDYKSWDFLAKVGAIVFLIVQINFIIGYNYIGSPIHSLANTFNLYSEYSDWDQMSNYTEYGFMNGLILNFTGENITPPDNYSEELIDEAMVPYIQLANHVNVSRYRSDFSDINVITILSETLSNPDDIDGIISPNSPLDYLIDPSDKLASGHMLSPVYGGGTPNTEYELITGMSYGSLRPTVSSAFQSFTGDREGLPSLFRAASSDNRETIAIHSYSSRFFKRTSSYEKFGVDHSYFERDMENTSPFTMYGYISDRSIYNEFLMHYEQADRPLNAHLVTMQNHAPFNVPYIDSPYQYEGDNLTEQQKLQLISYTEGIHETDLVTKEFIQELNEVGKPYILFLYGDHLPGIYGPILNVNDPITKYKTPYIMVTNLKNSQVSGENLDMISLTSTQNLIFEAASVKISPYQAMLMSLNESILAIHPTGYYLHEANSPVDYDKLSQKQQELVDLYHLIQYDLIDGNKYSAKYLSVQ